MSEEPRLRLSSWLAPWETPPILLEPHFPHLLKAVCGQGAEPSAGGQDGRSLGSLRLHSPVGRTATSPLGSGGGCAECRGSTEGGKRVGWCRGSGADTGPVCHTALAPLPAYSSPFLWVLLGWMPVAGSCPTFSQGT